VLGLGYHADHSRSDDQDLGLSEEAASLLALGLYWYVKTVSLKEIAVHVLDD
jgi:hypothetical protein